MSAQALAYTTSVVRERGRLIVCCEIEHFLPSGLTVLELFATLRPHLVMANEDAAARDPAPAGAPRAPKVQIDVDVADPEVTLFIRSPAAFLVDVDASLLTLQAIVTRFAENSTAPRCGSGR